MSMVQRLAVAPAFLLLAALFFAGLISSPAQSNGSAMVLPADPTPLVALTSAGEKRFTIEIADSPEERSRGLMYRERMAETQGMLFVFEQTQPVAFWMQNTRLPLDLLFISETGEVRAILDGKPFSTEAISAGEPVRFVLELNAGAAARAGIAVGDHIRHPVIDAVSGNR